MKIIETHEFIKYLNREKYAEYSKHIVAPIKYSCINVYWYARKLGVFGNGFEKIPCKYFSGIIFCQNNVNRKSYTIVYSDVFKEVSEMAIAAGGKILRGGKCSSR